MTTQARYSVDVLVIGSGLAGLSAASEASKQGARTALACNTALFSGSSFFPGTWGLGLVGPVDAQDEEDFISTITDVGMDCAQADLVEHFVRSITSCVEGLEEDGLDLVHPEHPEDSAYIPCFDHNLRRWRGITHKAARDYFSTKLEQGKVEILEHFELIDLISQPVESCGDESRSKATNQEGMQAECQGALFYDRKQDKLVIVEAAATVLATGGFAGLFTRHLTGSHIRGNAQALALQAGCRLVNLEFMQIMPGLVDPVSNIVFNEKVFRSVQFSTEDHADALAHALEVQKSPYTVKDVLQARAEHGPFTTHDISGVVDELIHQAGPEGLSCTCTLEQPLPEFVEVFDTWLYERAGIHLDTPMRLALYAHAANGGIAIDTQAATDVAGLYACGEATGGMHGADRIGGLASANALVFGHIAGASAAKHSMSPTKKPANNTSQLNYAIPEQGCERIPDFSVKLQACLYAYCMVDRSEHGLHQAFALLDALDEQLHTAATHTSVAKEIARYKRYEAQLGLARALVSATLARRETRGSHKRSDIPETRPCYARPQYLSLNQGKIQSSFDE